MKSDVIDPANNYIPQSYFYILYFFSKFQRNIFIVQMIVHVVKGM